jgi:hypothetical protein
MRKASVFVCLLLAVYAVPAIGQQSRNVLFPRFVTGGGWISEFFFANQGLAGQSINISFFDKNGNAVSVDSNLGIASSYSISLSAGATQVIQLNAGSAFIEGYAVVTYPDYKSPVRGTQIFRYELNGTVLVEVGGPQQESGQHYSFPVEVNYSKGINTAVGLTKPACFSSDPESLVVNLINADGTIRATALVPMLAGQHRVGYVDENWLFPGLDNFTGSISVSSPFGVGVLVLRQDREAFGAISADSGPVQFPFAVPGPAIQEVEPNDNETLAQSLSVPALVEGAGAISGDVDTYKFSGKGGDIVTIICDTTKKNSGLDPILFLLDANLVPVSANDQNGLAPRQKSLGDSFIQCVLPRDGIYYIIVSDYYGSGGNYDLHVNLRHP